MASFNTVTVIPLDAQHDWDRLTEACGFLTRWGLDYLRGGLGPYAKSAVVEPFYVCKDHRNLHSHFYSKKFGVRSPLCARIHFFGKPVPNPSDVHTQVEALGGAYLGYSVVRPVAQRCIGRTVIDPHRVGRALDDGYFLLRTRFRAHINGTAYQVQGFPTMSQDTEATVCAHSALWSVCRYLSERYSTYPETYPYDLIRMTTDRSHGRVVPYRGMTYEDYSSILSAFGCHPEIIRTKRSSGDHELIRDRYLDLCAYVESGFPILASYSGHVVALIGHTLNLAATPQIDEQGLASSTDFVRQMIVVDDNRFPYQLLGPHGDPATYSQKYGIESILAAVCPLPEKVFLPASRARRVASVLLARLRSEVGDAGFLAGEAGPLVTRLFLTSSAALQRRRRAKAMLSNPPDATTLIAADFHLPHFVWVMEVGPLTLYRQGRCTAEIVLDATSNTLEDGLLFARVGPQLHWRSNGASKRGDITTAPNHFEQYTHNLGEL